MMRFLIYTVSLLSVGLFSAYSSSGSIGGVDGEHPEAPEAYQTQLLELAFSGVSKMPLKPHIKNRSRAQLKVVDTCLELDEPLLAIGYIEEVKNWQRWMGYADLAAWHSKHAHFAESNQMLDKVLPALTMSEDIRSGKVVARVENPLIDTLKDGRYEAVLTRVEEVRRLNGIATMQRVDESRYGEVNAANLNVDSVADHKGVAEAVAALQPFTAHPNFEVAYYGLLKLAEVAADYYSEIDLQQLVKKEVDPRLDKVPVFLRINIYSAFSEAAIQHNDPSTALTLIDALDDMVAGLQARPRYYIPEAAKIIRLRNIIGQSNPAKAGIHALQTYYNEKRERVIDIDRAGLLCEIAELYQLIGNSEQAQVLYHQAVIEGRVNPNSRPRADDLNRICCSMALSKMEPSPELWRQLTDMHAELGAPW